MFTKTAITLTIIVGTASGALGAPKQNSSSPNWDAYDCRGVYVGADPKILIIDP